jgi:hypothetical protein
MERTNRPIFKQNKGDEMRFKKNDMGKLEWEMMPEEALEEVMKVLQFGANKYGKWNWLDNANEAEYTRIMNAIERHFKKFKKGQDLDEESSLPELAHVIVNCLFILQYQCLDVGIDNRRKNTKTTTLPYKRSLGEQP